VNISLKKKMKMVLTFKKIILMAEKFFT